MPRAPLKNWPFAANNLVDQVLADGDFQTRGYVWGFDGTVHYCFLDPARYRFQVWEKGTDPLRMAALAAHLAAAGLAAIFSGGTLAFALLLAIPSLPFALLGHYRWSARQKKAAVVTNGPQMQYPGGLSTNTMTSLGVASGALAAGFGALAGANLPTITWLGLTIGPVVLGLLGGLCAGANGMALFAAIVGAYCKPFGRVRGSGIKDEGVGHAGWSYILQSGFHRIASEQPPASSSQASGGLYRVVQQGALVGGMPFPAVTWALINTRWRDPEDSTSLEDIYHEDDPEYAYIDADLMLVAGSSNWGANSTALPIHGVVEAVATDGYVSPVLGSSGELVMECEPYMDPIQRYGFMCLPD